MELQEQLPTMIEVRNLEHVGFSSEQIASLLSIKASKRSISEGPITRPLLSTSGWRSSAGSTSRVACKAKSWSQRMRRGGWGMEQNLFCRF